MEDNYNKNIESNQSILFHQHEESKNSQEFYKSYDVNAQKEDECKKDASLNEVSFIHKDEFNNVSFISDNELDFINDKSINEYFDTNDHKNIVFDEILKKIDFLIYFFKYAKDNKIFNENSIIRFFQDKTETKEEKPNIIPIIKKKIFGIEFSSDNKNFKFLKTEDIINLILQKKTFVEMPIGQDNFVENEIKEDTIKIKFIKFKFYGINKIQKKAQKKFILNLELIEKLIQKYENQLNDYKKNESQKSENERKIRNIFCLMCKYMNNYLYWTIIKKLIKKSLGLKEMNQNYENLKINFEYAKNLARPSKINEKDELCLKSKIQKIKTCCLINFYSEKEVNNIIDKNIFIGINKDGYVYILLFNIAFNAIPNEKSQYILVKNKKLVEIKEPKRIVKINVKSNNIFNNIKNNYFLISSYKENIALITNVKEKLNNNLEDKYEIIVNTKIEFERGLYSSIEIEYNGLYYLLNYHKNFSLWFYDEKNNKVEHKEMTVIKLKCEEKLKKKYIFGPLIQNKNKNLIISQIIFPIQRIEVYELKDNLILNQKGYISLDDKTNYISRENNNYFLYKDKYLLLSSFKSKINKYNKYANKMEKKIINGGIYIFDIEKFICVSHIKYDDILTVNCLMGVNDNTLICSSTIVYNKYNKQSFRNGKLILLNIDEKNNELSLNRKETNSLIGNCKYINCDKFIFDSYFLCSSEDSNGIIQLNEKNEFKHYFNI